MGGWADGRLGGWEVGRTRAKSLPIEKVQFGDLNVFKVRESFSGDGMVILFLMKPVSNVAYGGARTYLLVFFRIRHRFHAAHAAG